MSMFRRSVLALTLTTISVPVLAGSLPDISQLSKGQTTYQQVVTVYGRPENIRCFADGHLTAFYVYNVPDPKSTRHGGFFHSLAKRVEATAKSAAHDVIKRHTSGLGVATAMVDNMAGQAADNAIDQLGQAVQGHPQAATGMNKGTYCVLKFDTHSLFSGGYCVARR